MFTPVRDNYALGWQAMKLLGRPVIDHSGGIDGFASHLAFYRDDGLVIIVLSNVAGEPAKITGCDLARIVFREGNTVLDRAPGVADIPAETLDQFVGTYTDAQVTRKIALVGAGLAYLRGESRTALSPLGGSRFLMDRSTVLTFDAGGGSFTIVDGCGSTLTTMKRIAPASSPGFQ